MRARRAGGSTASSCSKHLVRLSRNSQEREDTCADQSNIEAHWLDWATSQKANPPKPTAAQSISEDEATENDSQEYGEGVSRFHSLTHLSEQTRTFFPKSSGFPTPFPTPKGCGSRRTPMHNPELGQVDAIWSSIHLITSCSFQTTEREPNWICLGKVQGSYLHTQVEH